MKNQCSFSWAPWVIGAICVALGIALFSGFGARSGLLMLGTIGNVIILCLIVRFIAAQNRTARAIRLALDELRVRVDSDKWRANLARQSLADQAYSRSQSSPN
jgi:hypothetical protein